MIYHPYLEPYFVFPKARHCTSVKDNIHTFVYSLSISNPRDILVSFSFYNRKDGNYSKKKGYREALERYNLLSMRLACGVYDVYDDVCMYEGYGFSSLDEKTKEILKIMSTDRKVITNVPYSIIFPIQYFVGLCNSFTIFGFNKREISSLDYTIFSREVIEDCFSKFSRKYFSYMSYCQRKSIR